MEDPVKNRLEPSSLIMTACRCFYCGKEQTRIYTAFHLYGMKTCDDHYKLAVRDCRAYYHRNQIAMMCDITNRSILTFLNILRDLSDGFSVERSNGSTDSGWKVNDIDTIFESAYATYLTNGWSIPCIKGELKKNVRIIDFLKYVNGPENFSEIVDDAIIEFTEGIYKDDHNNYEAITDQKMPYIEHLSNVVNIILPSGEQGRVLMPSASSVAASLPVQETDPEE